MKKTSKRLHVSRVKIEYKLSNAHVCNNNNIYIYIYKMGSSNTFFKLLNLSISKGKIKGTHQY